MSGERNDGPGQNPTGRSARKSGGDGRLSVFNGVSQLCDTAVRMTGVDGGATALLTRRSELRDLVYATDPVAHRIDELQFTLGEGPCLDAYRLSEPQLVFDLADSTVGSQWPVFAGEALGVGASAVFAFPIADAGRTLGVLELYRATPGTLSPNEFRAGLSCATETGQTVMANWSVHLSQGDGWLESAEALALELAEPEPDDRFSRSQVFIASGMLAVQIGASPEEAMDRLRAFAFRSGKSVHDVADAVIARQLTRTDFVDGQAER